jgi:hypothetical protein
MVLFGDLILLDGDEFIHAHPEIPGDRKEDGQIGVALPGLPFRNRLMGDEKIVGQFLLREASLRSESLQIILEHRFILPPRMVD